MKQYTVEELADEITGLSYASALVQARIILNRQKQLDKRYNDCIDIINKQLNYLNSFVEE